MFNCFISHFIYTVVCLESNLYRNPGFNYENTSSEEFVSDYYDFKYLINIHALFRFAS